MEKFYKCLKGLNTWDVLARINQCGYKQHDKIISNIITNIIILCIIMINIIVKNYLKLILTVKKNLIALIVNWARDKQQPLVLLPLYTHNEHKRSQFVGQE